MSVEAETSQELVRLAYSGGSMVVNISRWGGDKGIKMAAYMQARLRAASENKLNGVIDLKKLNPNGEPLSATFIPHSTLKDFAKVAKKYGLLYSVVASSRGADNATADVFFRTVDAPKVKRILEAAMIATVEPDLSKVEIEGELNTDSNVIRAKVDMGDAVEGKNVVEKAKSPIESPSEKQLGKKERVSVRAELEKMKNNIREKKDQTLADQLREEFAKDKMYE